MKFFRIVLYASCVSLMAACSHANDTENVTIVVDHRPFSSVEKAAHAEEEVDWSDENNPRARACTESFAAIELRSFLADSGTGNIRFAAPGEIPAEGDLFILESEGITASGGAEDSAMKSPEAFRVSSESENGRVITRIEGGGREGVLYGVYAYLEELGFRFFGMGDEGIVSPEKVERFPSGIELDETPDFSIRGFMTARRGEELDEFFHWMARNRFNLWSAHEHGSVPLMKKLGIRLNGGLHAIQARYLNPEDEYPYRLQWEDAQSERPETPYQIEAAVRERLENMDTGERPTYFDVHPEWYGLHEGERNNDVRRLGVNYCTSNPDATAEFSRNLVESLAHGHMRHVDVLEFWMVDAGDWCECDNCVAEGSYTDRLLLTVHRVNQAIRGAQAEGFINRDVHVSTLAYIETVEPPSRPLPEDFDLENISVTFFPFRRCYVHALGDPECEEINAPIRRALEGWTGEDRIYRGSLRIGEYYNLSSYQSQPLVFTRILKEDIPYYYDAGVRHFHFMHVLHRNWGPWVLNHRLLSRALWDRTTDLDAAKSDLLTSYYPDTHRQMATFFEALEKATENIATWKARVITADGINYSLNERLRDAGQELFEIEHIGYAPEDSIGTSISEMTEYTQRARDSLDAAVEASRNATEQARLEDMEKRFAYGEAMMQFYHRMVRAVLADRAGDEGEARREVARMSELASKLEAMEDAAQVSADGPNSDNAFIATGARPQFRELVERYGEE